MDLLEVVGKIKLDASDYKQGLSEAEGASTKASSAISQAFTAIGQKINGAGSFISEFKAGFAEGMEEAVFETNKEANALGALKNRLEMAKNAVKASENEVARLAAEFNKSAKETGLDSEETQRLAQELDKAEKEMKDNQSELNKLEKELKEYGDAAEEASEKSSETGDKIKHAFGTVAKGGVEALKKAVEITAKAIAAAAVGVGALVKQSVSAYGEYEQLAGGAKKIFDEMDFSVIEKDAKKAFKELNMSMNDYIESINLAGATFSTTMGDKEAYETARTGMLAISDFATGTGKNINELTQKYQMITRAASSYQSIADQFAGILPQTSKDFLEQAKAAGFLSEEYEKLTDVPVAEYQQAVTKMLSKGVADLGLTQNALNESTGTLTGSMAMTKAAWQNLVMSLADENANLTEYIDAFVESLSASVKNILPVVEQALNGVGKLIETIVPQLADEINGLFEEGGVAENLLKAGKNVIESIAKGIDENIDTVVGFAETALEMLVEALDTVLPTLAKVGIRIVEALGGAIVDNLDTILETGGKILEQITKGLTEHIDDIVSAAMKIVESLGNFIVENADMLIDAAVEIILGLTKGITDHVGDLIPLALEILNAIASSILENIDVIIGAVPAIIDGFITGLVDNLPEMTKAWVKLMDTLETALPEIISAILEALPKIMDTIVNYYAGEGFSQTLQACLVMFGAFNKAINIIALEVIARIETAISEWASKVASAASELHAAAITGFQAMLTAIISKMSEIKSKITSTFSNIVSTIRSAFTNLASSALTWGKDMLQNFIDGIKQKFGALKSAVSGVSNMMANNLGHSHPKEGAMKDDYKWMPDMMDLFIQGIEDNEDRLRATVNSAFDFEDAITSPNMSGATIASGKSLGESAFDKILSNLQINMYNTTEIDGQAIKKDSYKYTINRLGDETRAVRVSMGGFA